MKKKIIVLSIVILVVVLSVVAAVLILDIETPDEYYKDDTDLSEDAQEKVTFTIDCTSIIDEADADFLNDGYLLRDVEIAVEEGDTVYSVLIKSAKKHKIIIDASQGYVSGIGGIYSGDFGDMSGWTYYVNGESPMVGANEYKVKADDVIRWVFIKDFSVLWG